MTSKVASRFQLPRAGDLPLALRSLSPRAWRWLFACLFVAFGATLWLIANLNYVFSTTVAAPGGSLSEGIIGSPRFINPLLAVSDSDRDLTALVYSGLMRVNERGLPEPDLAERVDVSDDGLTYTFHLRRNLRWHDGAPFSADDVEFTIASAQDPILKSPRRAGWIGVRVEKIDGQTIVFRLEQPYPSFLETATMGILPKHIWGKLGAEVFALNQFNTESVGSGPYRIKTIKKNSLGIPEYYDLEPFEDFALGAPKISALRLRFYSNGAELLNARARGEIEAAAAISAENAAALDATVRRSPLPRVFGVFFNQSRAPVLVNREVREALDLVIDRALVIATALKGYGLPATGPLPDFTVGGEPAAASPAPQIEEAKKLLEKKGWSLNEETGVWEKKTKKETVPLAFILTTSDTPELKRSAELIRDAWNQFGAQVELKVFEIGDLNQNIIRPRQYEALFFGEVLGRNPDLFAFWHSSQRLDPGLNIALYTNSAVDKALETARRTNDSGMAAELYQKFNEEVKSDVPAVFVYSPEFLYLLPEKVKNVVLPPINTAADRFLNIHRWFINTDRVWPIFVTPNNKI